LLQNGAVCGIKMAAFLFQFVPGKLKHSVCLHVTSS
jgi:hypothetical protein